MAEFDLKDIFRSAFGYEAPSDFAIPQAPSRIEYSSILGGAYYGSDTLGREFFLPVTLDNILLPFAVVSISCKKTIVSTPLPERQGSVHELINIEDYNINVKGIFISDDNSYPELQIIELSNLFLKKVSVKMQCVLTDIFLKGTFEQSVIIKEIKLPATIGVEHAKAFELELESDQVFELVID